MGSGTWPNEIKESGENIDKIILEFYDSSDEAYLGEKALISDLWKSDPKCKNMKPGGEESFFEKDVYSKYCEDRWGVSHHMKSKQYLEESNFKFSFCDAETQQKVDDTLRRKYGGRGSASVIIKEKVENTNLNKYGEKHTLNTKNVKDARESACVEKFGTTNPFENPDKMAEVLLERYGVTNMMHHPDVQKKHQEAIDNIDWEKRNEKTRRTNLEKYGVTTAMNLPEVRERNKRPCPYGCKDGHRYDAGNFSNHMIKAHSWTKEQIKEYKDENKTN